MSQMACLLPKIQGLGSIRAKSLQSLTRSCISKATETGLNVVALVCDQGSNNRSFNEHLEKVTIDRPYLIYENRKILVVSW